MPVISYADQGLNISCLNMKSILGIKYKPLRFTLEAVGFQYFDEAKNRFIMIKSNQLEIGEDFFTARFENYELGFQKIVFEGETKPKMVMTKYDYKNNKFLEHYACDAVSTYID